MSGSREISILGCGWLGWELAKFLIAKGHHVKGSTTSSEKIELISSSGIDAYLIDLSNTIDIQARPFFKSEILIINIPPGRRDPEYLNNYPNRITRAIEAASKGSINKIIYTSSTGVYASRMAKSPDWAFPIYTSQEPNAKGGSADVLIKAEELINASPIKSTTLRFGGLVGGDRKAGRFLAGKMNVRNGAAPVNMIHRDDCIQIITSIIEKSNWGFTWNAVADLHPSRASFYQTQAQKYDFKEPTFLDESEAQGKIISSEELKKDLLYDFIHPDPMQF